MRIFSFPHLQFVFPDFRVDIQYRQAPLVFPGFVQAYPVLMVRQYFAKGGDAHRPWSRFSEGVFKVATDRELCNLAVPALAAVLFG